VRPLSANDRPEQAGKSCEPWTRGQLH